MLVPASLLYSQEPSLSPVADPSAVVRNGNARFTVLTPQMIRMEWATNGVFDDRASFVFLNRRLAVPTFKVICDEVSKPD